MLKKKENIAEYILYLWQMEDYLRAFPEAMYDETSLPEVRNELQELSLMMHEENIVAGGHLQLAKNAQRQLEELSDELYEDEATYRAAILKLAPQLTILKVKTDNPAMSDVEAGLTLLYQVMLLRVQKKEITKETMQVVQDVTEWMRYLSKTFKEG